MAGQQNQQNSSRLDGCKGIAQKIGIGIVLIIVLALCGGVGLLVMKIGPEVLIFLICLLLCLGVPILGGVAWVLWQRRQNDEDE